MSCLYDDLEKFLKSDGVRILMDSGAIRVRRFDPLRAEDIENLEALDLDGMGREELEELQERAEDLLDELEDSEPEDEGGEEHDGWEDRLSDVEEFIDRIQEQLNEGMIGER